MPYNYKVQVDLSIPALYIIIGSIVTLQQVIVKAFNQIAPIPRSPQTPPGAHSDPDLVRCHPYSLFGQRAHSKGRKFTQSIMCMF